MKDYFISLELELSYSLINIEKILTEGHALGFEYLEFFINDSLETLSPKEAANYIFNIYPREEEPSSVLVAYKGKSFFLGFYNNKKNKTLEVNFLPDEARDQRYVNYECPHLDYSYYIKLSLQLLNKFKIKSLEIGQLGMEY